MSGVDQSALDIVDNAIKNKKIAIFCGAGISVNSGLPIVKIIVKKILEKLELTEEEIDEIINAEIPFEAFMEILSGNSDITQILNIYSLGKPNTNHIFIAKLAKKGFVNAIYTTNFDLLIEKALNREGLKENVDYFVHYNEGDFSDISKIKDKIHVIKIHGSISNIQSIRTTMKAVANKTLSDKRFSAIQDLFSTGEHDIVFIFGYSCSDILDISTQINSIKENKKIVVYQKHLEPDQTIEESEVNNQDFKNDKFFFITFLGKTKLCDTDAFIRELWDRNKDSIGRYKIKSNDVNWTRSIKEWSNNLKMYPGSNYFIVGYIFIYIANYNMAIKYIERCLKIAIDNSNRQLESACYSNLNIAYRLLGNNSKAIWYLEKSMKIAIEDGDRQIESICYTNLGHAHYNLGNYYKAIEYQEKSLKIAVEIGDRERESTCYAGLGIAYHRLCNYNKAIQYHEKSLKIDVEIGDRQGEFDDYTNLGNLYNTLNDHPKAIEYYAKSLKIAIEMGNRQGESTGYGNIGYMYFTIKDYKKAIEYTEASLKIAEDIGDRHVESTGYMGLGMTHESLGDFKKAIEYLEKGLKIAIEIGDRQGELTGYMGLGILNNNFGDFKKAIEYLEKGLKIAIEIGDRHGESKFYGNLAHAYENLGDNNHAIELYEKASNSFKEIGQEDSSKQAQNSLSILRKKIKS